MNQDSLRALLAGVLTPDTARVKESTAKLKKDYYGSPQSLGLLLQILVSQDNIEIRQLAATEARKLVPKYWAKIPDGQKPDIRSHLLQSTMEESNKAVRHASSRLIGAIAQKDIAKSQWTDLPNIMLEGATNSSPQAREVSTYILFSILDELEDSSAFDYKSMFHAFSQTIQDLEHPEVPMNTIFALSKIAIEIDTDGDDSALATFRQFIPKIITVLLHFINTEDTDHTTQTFECLQTILDATPKILDPHFRELVQGMASIAEDSSKDPDTRTQALNFLLSCVIERKMKFQSLRLGNNMTKMIFDILSSDDAVPTADDEKDLTTSCLHLLSLMASELPPPQVAGPVVELFKKYAKSSEIRQRQAAITILATVVEGATDFVATQLPELLPSILKLLNDPSDKVRESSVLACRDIADSLPEVMAKEHEQFLSALAKNLQSAMQGGEGPDASRHLKVAANCCLAIDGLVTGLEAKDVRAYMPELVPNLSRLFSHPNSDIRKSAISAVGSLAKAAEKDFMPYFEQTMDALSQFAEVTEPEEELALRAIAVDTMGDLAEAVGPVPFRSYVQPLIKSSEEGLALDYPRLKETSYMLWGSLSKVYKEEFKPFLGSAVQKLYEALAQQEDADIEVPLDDQGSDLVGQEVIISGKKIKVVGENELDDDDDDDDEESWNDIMGYSDVAQEKEVALEALADIFSNTGKEYLPYYEKTVEAILPLLEHSSEGVRGSAISAMFRLYASLWNLQPEAQSKWEPGLPIKTPPSTEIEKIRDLLMTKVMSEYPTEDDSEIIMEFNQSLAEALTTCGPFLISSQGTVETLVRVLTNLLAKEHPCQQEYEDVEDLLDDQNSEDAWLVIESALDVVYGMAQAFGPQFAELWKIFEKSVLKHASATSATERAATVGTIAEVIKGMKEGCTPFTDSFLKIILHRLSDESTAVKINASYAIGMLVEKSQKEAVLKKAYPSILSKLEPLLQMDDAHLLDNAAGCVARLIAKYPDNLPIGDVLPVLVNLLPLKEDYEENTPVWSMIVHLYKSGNDTVQHLTPQIAAALEKTLSEPEDQIKDETKEEVGQMVTYWQSKQPNILQQYPGLSKALD